MTTEQQLQERVKELEKAVMEISEVVTTQVSTYYKAKIRQLRKALQDVCSATGSTPEEVSKKRFDIAYNALWKSSAFEDENI
jgi:hypothetical protein